MLLFFNFGSNLIMKNKYSLLLFLIFSSISLIYAQETGYDLNVNVKISPTIKKSFSPDGRLFLFLVQNPNVEPRTQTWPNPGNNMFAKNFTGWKSSEVLNIENSEGWSKTPGWSLSSIPAGEYYVQLLWDQDTLESRIDAPGNIYSEKQKINLSEDKTININLDKIIAKRTLIDNPMVKEVVIKSDTLSKWWGKEMDVKASVLLPADYEKGKKYPIIYTVAGYGGRYDRINRVVENDEFMNWWKSDDAPKVIMVFLDGEGPYGDSYQLDSDNSGPYGYALTKELAPTIEKEYRGTSAPETRFVGGCSTGGWVSLALQIYYPDFFNGVFSYSPDAIDFENYQLIDIYKDDNAFVNEFGYLRPVMRSTKGEPMVSLKDFINYENVLGASNTYVTSGGQFSAHTALYSPKGADGFPEPLFDPKTGKIDHSVAQKWEKYDLKKYAGKKLDYTWP